jgi:hypothetical protein
MTEESKPEKSVKVKRLLSLEYEFTVRWIPKRNCWGVFDEYELCLEHFTSREDAVNAAYRGRYDCSFLDKIPESFQ